MTRPEDLAVIDLMLEIPTGKAGMGMKQARQLTKDKGTDDFSHHPAQYLFKDAGDRMSIASDPDAVVAMMDQFGVQMAQIAVNPRYPEGALAMFEQYPDRFFGEVGVDPNAGMESVRALEQTVGLHRNIKAASAAPCLLNPQVPIDDRRFYPIYAKCCELDIPINMLVGVPGPRVPYRCQHPGLLDEVAYFFPELKVVMRHGGDPWTDLCVKLLLKWPNLYYSTSAWAPKHYPKNIIEFANKRGRDKVMFAGYFPGISYERIFSELDGLPHSEETWPAFLRDNAMDVYKLQDLLKG
ncbi:MAG: amidohydrolase family protein [Gammaproteobacteria bacterium]|nr:amidohydrolase family protein [Gammaproteobacteria bacterium]